MNIRKLGHRLHLKVRRSLRKWAISASLFLLFILLAPACQKEGAMAPGASHEPSSESFLTGNPATHPGQSGKGQAFDEGPRQAAVLMSEAGLVSMPVTVASASARQFFFQGLSQLHGSSPYEAERSFRQAAKIYPPFAMAYWGMAMANTILPGGNSGRAKEFIEIAHGLCPTVTAFESMWIRAVHSLYHAGLSVSAQSRETFAQAIKEIAAQYPDEGETKAFLALVLLENATYYGASLDPEKVDRLLEEVIGAEPGHPGAYQYKIRLWADALARPEAIYPLPELALKMAPGLAHLPEISSHVYWSLGRYAESARAQGDSASIDNEAMRRSFVWPYETQNYLPNGRELIASLGRMGDFDGAREVANNLISIPRHPEKNTHYGPLAIWSLASVLDEQEQWAVAKEQIKKYEYDFDGMALAKLRRERLGALVSFYEGDLVAAQKGFAAVKSHLPATLKLREHLIRLEVSVYEALIKNSISALSLIEKLEREIDLNPSLFGEVDCEDYHLDLLYQRLGNLR